MTPSLSRRALAELLGTALLVAVVVGSGIAAQRLTADHALQLLVDSLATAAALPVLILVLGPLSGGHFNPLVSLSDWFLGRRDRGGIAAHDLAAYLPAQIVGAIGGCVLANSMFDASQQLSGHARPGVHLWLGELVATAGLMLVIVGSSRSGKADQAPWAIGAYIGAAYWFTSSTSFANPAVTIGRMFTNTFAGIAPRSAPGFIGAQLVGAAIGVALIVVLYPRRTAEPAGLVIPHERIDVSR